MRANLMLSAATLLCVLLSADAGVPNYSSVHRNKPIQLPEELVAQLMIRRENKAAGVTLHPGNVGHSSGYQMIEPRHPLHSSYEAQARAVVPCNSETTVSPGTPVEFESTNYPDKYPKNENCKWVFKAEDQDATLTIVCCPFNVEKSGSCKKDSLSLTEVGTDPDFAVISSTVYCGMTDSFTYTSSTNEVTALFKTNKKKQRPGFSCTVTVNEDETTTVTTTSTTPKPTCDCGKVNRNTRIVGGVETEVNEYPWQVGLVTSSYYLVCGGSIISEYWVLTAAHCISDGLKYVLVGDHDWTDASEASAFLIDISQVTVHPDYNNSTSDSDIALLLLDTALDFSMVGVGPVCLPFDVSESYAGEMATVTGWGATSQGGRLSTTLQEVDVPILTNLDCSVPYPSLTDNMVCAGFPQGGKDSCQGDSGGPLVFLDGEYYDQIGVVSFGFGCAQPGYPGAYTRITEFLGWIQSTTGDSGEVCTA